MTETLDEILTDLFHGCALAAFLEQADLASGFPCPEMTRRRAFELYEQALAEKNVAKPEAHLHGG